MYLLTYNPKSNKYIHYHQKIHEEKGDFNVLNNFEF